MEQPSRCRCIEPLGNSLRNLRDGLGLSACSSEVLGICVACKWHTWAWSRREGGGSLWKLLWLPRTWFPSKELMLLQHF